MLILVANSLSSEMDGDKPQKMVFNLPKGMWQVLEERGINIRGMKAEEMKASHPDFKIEHRAISSRGKEAYNVHVAEVPLRVQSNRESMGTGQTLHKKSLLQIQHY